MAKKKSLKKIPASKENPFNVKINRNKFSILGQKVKGTRGLPGISHSICNAKRKEEFHKKRMLSQKANKFIDKRFMDSSLSFEEQATVRLVEERKRKFKKNIFNLNDEESLTHKGVPIENLKLLDDTMNDSDDDEQLDPKFVKQAHFGGFTGDPSSAPKSRKEIIDELIVESKRRKLERKMVKEKNDELIEQLDQKWKAMHHQLIPSLKSKQKIEEKVEKKDPFDILLNELKFEMRTAPPQREKSAEEIAREEKEKQNKLEEERNKRMRNPLDYSESKENQLSADSLYDGLDIQFEPIDEEIDNTNVNANEMSDDDDESEEDSSSEDENEFNNDDLEDNDIISVADNGTDFPDTIDKFCALIANQSEDLYTVVSKIIQDKVRHKSKENIQKLEILFAILYDYITNLKNKTIVILEHLDDILPHLYTLAEVSPVNTAEKLLKFLDDEHDLFQQSKGKKMKKNFPRSQCLVLFKIVSSIYSVSDFKHPVVTPAIIFMCDVLSSPYAVSFQNIYSRLYICKIVFDCVSFSKLYVPEVLCFLNKTLKLVLSNSKKFNLFIKEEAFEENTVLNFEIDDKSCDHSIKVKLISEVIELLHQYAVLYEHVDCFKEIFHTTTDILTKIIMMDNFSVFPPGLKNIINSFKDFVEIVQKTYKPLIFEHKKPVPLKLFEPAFDSQFTRKKDDIQKKRKLIKSINQKIRKEEKGQLREIRRDNQVIAAEKLKEKLEADEERKRKVKQLYSELAMQEGEYKKYAKKK